MSNIVVKEVSKSFDDAEVLHDINLEFKEGHIYGFVGRNGSGKSVLFKILCGLYFPTTGSVVIDGVDIHKNNIFPNNMRVFIEKPNFLPNLTGLENLKLLASIQNKITEDDIIDILNKLNLKDDMNKLYHKYSLGMKQKLRIAQAIMENQKLIILDEPTNGLDEASIKTVHNIIKKLKNEDKLILIASHNKDDLRLLCDKIFKIDNGQICGEIKL